MVSSESCQCSHSVAVISRKETSNEGGYASTITAEIHGRYVAVASIGWRMAVTSVEFVDEFSVKR